MGKKPICWRDRNSLEIHGQFCGNSVGQKQLILANPGIKLFKQGP